MRVRPAEMVNHGPPPFPDIRPPIGAPRMEIRDPRVMEPRLPLLRDLQGLTQAGRGPQVGVFSLSTLEIKK